MDYCSYFIKDKALFGSYPTVERARELVDNGVSVFIDLTTESEKTTLDNYYDNINDITYINYEIIDRRIPTNIQEFTIFIIKIMNIIKTHDQKIYIHCKGGHGRAGIVVSCLLCFLYNVTPQQSLEMTTKFHGTRKMMRAKWRTIGSPQTPKQKIFVVNFCKPLYFFKAYKNGNTIGLSTFSRHEIEIPNLGKFPTCTSAYYAYKNQKDLNYIEKLKSAETPQAARLIGIKYSNPPNWDKNKYDLMKNLTYLKLNQHPEILKNLITSTGLRPIIFTNKSDSFWGIGEDNKGQNKLGEIWNNIRYQEYTKLL